MKLHQALSYFGLKFIYLSEIIKSSIQNRCLSSHLPECQIDTRRRHLFSWGVSDAANDPESDPASSTDFQIEGK